MVRERGVIIGSWDIAVCRDYRGLAGYKQNPLARGDGGSPGRVEVKRLSGLRGGGD